MFGALLLSTTVCVTCSALSGRVLAEVPDSTRRTEQWLPHSEHQNLHFFLSEKVSAIPLRSEYGR